VLREEQAEASWRWERRRIRVLSPGGLAVRVRGLPRPWRGVGPTPGSAAARRPPARCRGVGRRVHRARLLGRWSDDSRGHQRGGDLSHLGSSNDDGVTSW